MRDIRVGDRVRFRPGPVPSYYSPYVRASQPLGVVLAVRQGVAMLGVRPGAVKDAGWVGWHVSWLDVIPYTREPGLDVELCAR